MCRRFLPRLQKSSFKMMISKRREKKTDGLKKKKLFGTFVLISRICAPQARLFRILRRCRALLRPGRCVRLAHLSFSLNPRLSYTMEKTPRVSQSKPLESPRGDERCWRRQGSGWASAPPHHPPRCLYPPTPDWLHRIRMRAFRLALQLSPVCRSKTRCLSAGALTLALAMPLIGRHAPLQL